jgi:hypothetical protein
MHLKQTKSSVSSIRHRMIKITRNKYLSSNWKFGQKRLKGTEVLIC